MSRAGPAPPRSGASPIAQDAPRKRHFLEWLVIAVFGFCTNALAAAHVVCTNQEEYYFGHFRTTTSERLTIKYWDDLINLHEYWTGCDPLTPTKH